MLLEVCSSVVHKIMDLSCDRGESSTWCERALFCIALWVYGQLRELLLEEGPGSVEVFLVCDQLSFSVWRLIDWCWFGMRGSLLRVPLMEGLTGCYRTCKGG